MFKYLAVSIVATLACQAYAFNVENIVMHLARAHDDANLQTEKVLGELSRQENRQLPRLVNATLQFDRVSVEPGPRYVRHFTVLNALTFPEEGQGALADSAFIQQICADKRQQIILKNDVTVVHYYRFSPEGEVKQVTVTRSDCS